MKLKKRAMVLASGDAKGGGSGYDNLELHILTGALNLDVVVVISNNQSGGVSEKAVKHGRPFEFFEDPKNNSHRYQEFVDKYKPDFILLSGWMFFVRLPEEWAPKILNIHPSLTRDPRLGGKGKYGHHVHETAHQLFLSGEIDRTGVTIHFVIPLDPKECPYDSGPRIFEYEVPIMPGDTPDTIAARVNKIEHAYQWWITSLVINGIIVLGKTKEGAWMVYVPFWYYHQPFCAHGPGLCVVSKLS